MFVEEDFDFGFIQEKNKQTFIVSFRFVSQSVSFRFAFRFVSFRFAKYSKPIIKLCTFADLRRPINLTDLFRFTTHDLLFLSLFPFIFKH